MLNLTLYEREIFTGLELLSRKLKSILDVSEFYFVSLTLNYKINTDSVVKLPASKIDKEFSALPIIFNNQHAADLHLKLPEDSRNHEILISLIENFVGKIELFILKSKEYETNLKSELEKNELRFRTIFEQSPMSIQLCSTDGKTLLVNPAWKKLWQISDEVIENYILKDYNMLQDPILEAQQVAEYIKQGFAGQITRVPMIPYNTQEAGLGAAIRMVEGLIFPLRDAAGNMKEIVLIHTDVTKEKKVETHKTFLDKLTSILITTLDYDQILIKIAEECVEELADGCILDIIENNQIKRVVTKHKDPAIQVYMDELQAKFPPTIDSPQPTARVIRSQQAEITEYVNHDFIDTHTYDSDHAKLIRKIGLKSHIAIPIKIRDITIGSICLIVTTEREMFNNYDMETFTEVARRIGMAIENSQLYREAQRAIQQRDEFISIASHELKTPITSMKLQLHLADRTMLRSADGMISSKHVKTMTDLYNKQLNRITILVEDMLDIARISSNKLALNIARENISESISETLKRLSGELVGLDKLITINIDSEIVADFDSFRIEQVLVNLLSNALRYGNNSPINVNLSMKDQIVYISVSDLGPGIDPIDQQRIFGRFERAVHFSNISGLGLGLFISRQIMHQHKGDLIVQSTLGEGSTFTAYFPIFSL